MKKLKQLIYQAKVVKQILRAIKVDFEKSEQIAAEIEFQKQQIQNRYLKYGPHIF